MEQHPFTIVCIGGSAGCLDPAIELVSNLPADSQMAFVFITHHDPAKKSLLPEILARHCAFPVLEITDGLALQPNRLYTCPSSMDAELGAALKLTHCMPDRHSNINCLFESLAKVQGDRSAAVVLSGMLRDGGKGIQAVKEAGGVTFAQDPVLAAFPSMPAHAIATGCVDYVLSPRQIAEYISGVLFERKKSLVHVC